MLLFSDSRGFGRASEAVYNRAGAEAVLALIDGEGACLLRRFSSIESIDRASMNPGNGDLCLMTLMMLSNFADRPLSRCITRTRSEMGDSRLASRSEIVFNFLQ